MINKWFTGLILVVASLSFKPVFADEIQAVTSELPPFSMEKTKKPGFLKEVVEEMMSRSKLKMKLSFFPWKRSQYLAQNQKDMLIFGITRTNKREPHYAWLVKLLNTDKVFVSTKLMVNDFKSAKTLDNISVRFATPYEYKLKAEGFQNYVVAHSEEQSARNLKRGVADAWMTLRHRAEYMWKSEGYDIKELKIGKSLSKSALYLAGNLSLKDNHALKEKLQQAYDGIVADGTFSNLHMKYFGRPSK